MFDVDSTLIAHEAIEEIADVLGKRDLVASITDRAMRGEIDFVEALNQRVQLLEGVKEEELIGISKTFRINEGASELIEHVHSIGGKACAVSGGFRSLLHPIAEELGLDDYRANTLELESGKLTGRLIPPIIDAHAKKSALISWSKEFGISLSKTMAIGDGANDLLMMEAAAVSVGFMPKPIVAKSCDYVIDRPDFRAAIGLLP